MMSEFAIGSMDGALGVTAVVILIAFVAHEPWRWAGLWLGRGVSVDSEFFLWVRLVSSALVAGLVMRVIVFPAGALESIGLGVRLFALLMGVVAFVVSGRSLALGVFGGAMALVAGGYAFG